MNDADITTASQLDAALAAQRDRRIAKLKRTAGLRFNWILALAAAGVLFNIGAYVSTGYISSLANAGVMVLIAFSGVRTMKEKRLNARKELEALQRDSAA